MWTFDQWMHLLAVLAWPAVAVIAGVAWVHGCRLLLESVDAITSAVIRCVNDNSGKWSRIALQGLARYADTHPPTDPRCLGMTTQVRETSERAMLAVLAARGGFPARQNEAPGRSLVREVREMYDEIRKPTPRPEPVAGSPAPGMTDLMVTPESLDEYLGVDGGLDGAVDDLYAGMVTADEDTGTDAEMGDLE